jgi:hypothetical protein
MITIGIDPGWASFGVSITKNGDLVAKTSFVPKDFGTRSDFILHFREWFNAEICALNVKCPVKHIADSDMIVFMERFVAYAGVQVSNSEDILMLIGGLEQFFSARQIKVVMMRALDWKVRMCHHLVKTQGFSNPGKNFDKKYSLLLAKTLSGEEFKSDHIADAVCMSYLTEEILCGNK